MNDMTGHRCQWRGCQQEAHCHDPVRFAALDGDYGPIWLCKEHCKRAKRTGRIDIPLSKITMVKVLPF